MPTSHIQSVRSNLKNTIFNGQLFARSRGRETEQVLAVSLFWLLFVTTKSDKKYIVPGLRPEPYFILCLGHKERSKKSQDKTNSTLSAASLEFLTKGRKLLY